MLPQSNAVNNINITANSEIVVNDSSRVVSVAGNVVITSASKIDVPAGAYIKANIVTLNTTASTGTQIIVAGNISANVINLVNAVTNTVNVEAYMKKVNITTSNTAGTITLNVGKAYLSSISITSNSKPHNLVINGNKDSETYNIFVNGLTVNNKAYVTFNKINSLYINGVGGNNTYNIVETPAPTRIDAGSGNDKIYIGELYTKLNASRGDITKLTDGSYISNGATYATTVNGGSGDDYIRIYSTLAALTVTGDNGNDSVFFKEFRINKENKYPYVSYNIYGDVEKLTTDMIVDTYTVVKNDCLYNLAIEFGCTVDDLVRWNNIKTPNLIYPGDVLYISSNKTNVSDINPASVVGKTGYYKTAGNNTEIIRYINSNQLNVSTEKTSVITVPQPEIEVNIPSGIISKIQVGTSVSKVVAAVKVGEVLGVYKDSQSVAANAIVGTGYKVQIKTSENITEELEAIVTGDVNGDSKVTITDYVLIKAHILKNITLGGVYFKAADINGDGKLTITDYVLVKGYILREVAITARTY